jgi:hypothetical protein
MMMMMIIIIIIIIITQGIFKGKINELETNSKGKNIKIIQTYK